jgi:FtsH-binding integral membrane protein
MSELIDFMCLEFLHSLYPNSSVKIFTKNPVINRAISMTWYLFHSLDLCSDLEYIVSSIAKLTNRPTITVAIPVYKDRIKIFIFLLFLLIKIK